MRVTLRPYQQRAVDDLRSTYRAGHKAPLLVLSTGGGKTVVFTHIAESAVARGNRVVILVHRQELLRQTSDHLGRLGVEHGLIAPGHTYGGEQVQVASVQTLARRIGKIHPPTLLIIDEAHHANAQTWRTVVDTWSSAKLLGVTATPVRLDGTGLGAHVGGYFDTLVNGPTIRELIDAGYLAQPIVYAPPSGLDMSAVHSRYGDYVKSELVEAVDKPKITGSAIEHYKRLCPGVPAIAFCASVEHAVHVANEFREAGISAESLDGEMTSHVRKNRIESLANGSIQVLTSCDIISEGTDIPVVTAAILLRPTQSEGLYLQQVGRALRVHPGKANAIILDHVGNCMRHGLPDEVREWTLDGEKRKKRMSKEDAGPALKQCEQCYAMFSAELVACPQCGAPVEVVKRSIEQVAGELVQMSKDQVQHMRKQLRREQGQSESLEALIAMGKARGYHPQWAYRVWGAREAKKLRKQSQAA